MYIGYVSFLIYLSATVFLGQCHRIQNSGSCDFLAKCLEFPSFTKNRVCGATVAMVWFGLILPLNSLHITWLHKHAL